MNTDSNKYVFLYITILVLIVAVVLSLFSIKLQPLQKANTDIEKMYQILTAANYKNISKENVINQYEKLTTEIIINNDGNVVSVYYFKNNADEVRAFNLSVAEEYQKAFDGKTDYILPVFAVKNPDNSITNVIPVAGKGLWGPIWGYVAIASDGNTITGAIFDHKSETPGLGGEISTEKFASMFEGKMLFNNKGEYVAVKLVKGGILNSNIDPKHGVDAISGGTITSQGIEKMIHDCLKLYIPYINNKL
ncbi:MAG: NADH:ubiquinone reductase (Na(+)-transporting) subunit C [Bacteroidales bacterium]|jgi:Na+-transporting NADH:ubiquinone oxidoreductase subunit C|nr:NADH:ubiquinone reductase (Na(+)-transporting) subunit C [Bacteroidales bacterium]